MWSGRSPVVSQMTLKWVGVTVPWRTLWLTKKKSYLYTVWREEMLKRLKWTWNQNIHITSDENITKQDRCYGSHYTIPTILAWWWLCPQWCLEEDWRAGFLSQQTCDYWSSSSPQPRQTWDWRNREWNYEPHLKLSWQIVPPDTISQAIQSLLQRYLVSSQLKAVHPHRNNRHIYWTPIRKWNIAEVFSEELAHLQK